MPNNRLHNYNLKARLQAECEPRRSLGMKTKLLIFVLCIVVAVGCLFILLSEMGTVWSTVAHHRSKKSPDQKYVARALWETRTRGFSIAPRSRTPQQRCILTVSATDHDRPVRRILIDPLQHPLVDIEVMHLPSHWPPTNTIAWSPDSQEVTFRLTGVEISLEPLAERLSEQSTGE